MPSTLLSSLHAIRLRSNLDYPHSLVRSLRMLQDGVHAVVNRRRVVPLLRQIPYIVLKLRELLDLGGRLSSLHPVLCSTLTTIVNTLHIPCDTLVWHHRVFGYTGCCCWSIDCFIWSDCKGSSTHSKTASTMPHRTRFPSC
jgi:hypothetical protein